MSTIKTLKKGDFLFREGEKISSVYIIQSGLATVLLPRPKKNVDLYQASNGQILGEEGLFGAQTYSYSVLCLNETKVFELPLTLTLPQIEAAPQLIKLLLKGTAEKAKLGLAELKTVRVEKDSTPCAPENTAKVFGVIYHVVNYIGTKNSENTVYTIDWNALKKYAQRVFLESPTRLEQACYVLCKLKMATFTMTKDESDPKAIEELGTFTFTDLKSVERFFDFYQNYFFKGNAAEILKTDDRCMQVVDALLKISDGVKIDRAGVVYLNYKDTLDQLKEVFGQGFTLDSLARLEQKGLFLKRDPDAKGGVLSFFREEYVGMAKNWAILREVEKWNDKGVVELVEEVASNKNGANRGCPKCNAPTVALQKFCGNCGANLTQ